MKTEIETKHTPGPFSISGIPGDNHVMARVGNNRVTVAQVVGWRGIDPSELEANKALFAAAPELLAALEEITERYSQLDRRLVASQHSEPNGTISRALSAIAKAKGTP